MLTNAGSPAIIYYIGLIMRHKRKLSSAEVEGAGESEETRRQKFNTAIQ